MIPSRQFADTLEHVLATNQAFTQQQATARAVQIFIGCAMSAGSSLSDALNVMVDSGEFNHLCGMTDAQAAMEALKTTLAASMEEARE